MKLRTAILTFAFLAAIFTPLVFSQTPAPSDPPLIDAQGYAKILAKYHGKPLLINFWATWCEPCRDEYPMLNDLAKQYASQGLQVVGVNYDQDGDLILMRRFLARYKPVFPNYRKKPGHDDDAFTQTVSATWSGGSLPATFLYDRNGRMVNHFIGANTREGYESAIRVLLAH